jgi:cytochrome c553
MLAPYTPSIDVCSVNMFTFRTNLLLTSVVILTAALLVGLSHTQSANAQSMLRGRSQRSMAGEASLDGRKLAEAQCAACHGVDGNSTDPQYPKIAGQNPYYIRLQLRAFKSGARQSDIMSGIASMLTETQIVELTRYFSEQQVKPDGVKDPQLAAIGARIFHFPAGGAPPCIACHGGGGYGPGFGHGGMMGGRGGMMGGHMGMMMGVSGVVPNLYGQHADYIVRQLAAFARGERRSNVMSPIAAAWRKQDHRAVAEYLSGLR